MMRDPLYGPRYGRLFGHLFGAALLASLLTSPPAVAAPIPAVDVPAMAGAAELIVAGRVGGVEFRPDGTENFTVSVDRVLKGPAHPSSATVPVRLDLSLSAAQTVAQQQYGLFFLRRLTAGGGYTAVDPAHAALVAAPDRSARPPEPPDPAALLAAVAGDLAQVFLTPAPPPPPTAPAADSPAAPAAYLAAAEALRSIPYRDSGDALRRVADAGSVVARLWALDSLLLIGDPDGGAAAALGELKAVTPSLVHPSRDLIPAVSAVANALEGHLTAPEAVDTLAALLASSQVAVRRAAASVLSDIATPATIAPLARSALQDTDRRVRYYAVLGLALATNTPGAPSLAQFERQESQIVGHWRDWAKVNAR
jgi:hypothetical protein